MSLFDESKIVARHQSLATLVSDEAKALRASTDLIRKAVLSFDTAKMPVEVRDDLTTAAILALRVVNNAGACTKLLDSGYFAQSASHIRDTVETAMLGLLFSEDPAHISIWRVAETARHSLYGRSQLRKKVKQKRKFELLDTYFDTFSQYGGHPSAETIIAHHNGVGFQIGPHFNPRLYTTTYREIAISTWWATDACKDMWYAMGGVALSEKFTNEVEKFRASADAIFPR